MNKSPSWHSLTEVPMRYSKATESIESRHLTVLYEPFQN
jgi:hypothetical protein